MMRIILLEQVYHGFKIPFATKHTINKYDHYRFILFSSCIEAKDSGHRHMPDFPGSFFFKYQITGSFHLKKMTYSNQRQGGLIMLTDRFITKQTMDRFYEYLIEEGGAAEPSKNTFAMSGCFSHGWGPIRSRKRMLLDGSRSFCKAAAHRPRSIPCWRQLTHIFSLYGLGRAQTEIDPSARRFPGKWWELTKAEYQLLMETAKKRGDERLALLMETICATGIRVSEVPYITTDAIKKGRARISMKGKLRTILIPAQLCRKLRKYATKHRIGRGEIFLTKNGTRLERKQIWAQMKALCKYAGIERNKVFPHNLRHLFARCFYRISHDISSLADVLGHSSIETTRIYLISTESEHIKKNSPSGACVEQNKYFVRSS